MTTFGSTHSWASEVLGFLGSRERNSFVPFGTLDFLQERVRAVITSLRHPPATDTVTAGRWQRKFMVLCLEDPLGLFAGQHGPTLECIFPGVTVVRLWLGVQVILTVGCSALPLSLAVACGTDTLGVRWVSLRSWHQRKGSLATFWVRRNRTSCLEHTVSPLVLT